MTWFISQPISAEDSDTPHHHNRETTNNNPANTA